MPLMFPGGCERGVKKQSAPCGVFCSNHDGDFELADSRYTDSPERTKLGPNPARHLEKTERWMLRDRRPQSEAGVLQLDQLSSALPHRALSLRVDCRLGWVDSFG